jgi:hypothetical protein
MGISSCRTHPAHFLIAKASGCHQQSCAAKKSPAIAVTAMRGVQRPRSYGRGVPTLAVREVRRYSGSRHTRRHVKLRGAAGSGSPSRTWNGTRLGAEDVQFRVVRRCRRAVAGLVFFLVRHCFLARRFAFPARSERQLLRLLGEPVVIGGDIQHRLLGGWITRTHRDGSGVRRHLRPSLYKARLTHLC